MFIALCIMIFSMNVYAAEITSGDHKYVTDGTNATITDYVGTDLAVTIPNTIDGYSIDTEFNKFFFWMFI